MPSVVGEITKGAVFARIVDRTNVSTNIASKTTAYTATTADDVILCNTSAGTFAVTLYTAVSNNGRGITIKKTDSSANALTIDGNASETIDGATTKEIQLQNSSMTIVSDNNNWNII